MSAGANSKLHQEYQKTKKEYKKDHHHTHHYHEIDEELAAKIGNKQRKTVRNKEEINLLRLSY